MHPIGSLVTGAFAGAIFTTLFTIIQQRFKYTEDVLGVWPLHGVCGAWEGTAAGIFGSEALGGLSGVSFISQLLGSLGGIMIATLSGFIVYGIVKSVSGLRLSEEDEFNGADLSIHKIGSIDKE